MIFLLGLEVGLSLYICLSCCVFLLLLSKSDARIVGKIFLNTDGPYIRGLA